MRQGVFYPELVLGAAALNTNRRAELQRFLAEVVRQRGFPLHLANLWNTLYFNYSLETGGFLATHLTSERIPTRTAQARDFSLPVGSFMRLHTRTASGDLLAEVIYKEGAHPDPDEGWIAPELSGAPTANTCDLAGHLMLTVRERFVLDLNAFGPDGNHINPTQYQRLCRRARWIDSHGHLLMEAMYTPDEANLEDLDQYVNYLLKEHHNGLLAFCFTEPLSADDLREALLRSFDTVRELASTTDELCNWRGKYFFPATTYRQRLANQGPLGQGDLHALFRGLAQLPSRERTGYAPLGPRILELLGRGGFDADEQALVRGPSYVNAICHTNHYIAERLERDQQSGILANGIHLRLDDDWLAGGIWRAERVDDPHHYALKAVPPTLPLHLGYAHAGGAAPDDTMVEQQQPIAATQTGFKLALTMRDRALGRLQLPPSAVATLASGMTDTVIRHGQVSERRTARRNGSALYGLEYPWDLHPGIILHCSVEAGGGVVRVRTTPVTPPITASDGTAFDYETNVAVYERELRLVELPVKDKRDAPTLRDLINRAFRLRGRPHGDARALTIPDLASVIYGPKWSAADIRAIAVAIADMHLERKGHEYLWRPRVSSRTQVSDRAVLEANSKGRPPGRLELVVHHHLVPMHLRHYTKRVPSSAKRDAYADARQRYGMFGVLPETLPPDCTWVAPYDWRREHAAPDDGPTLDDTGSMLDRPSGRADA